MNRCHGLWAMLLAGGVIVAAGPQRMTVQVKAAQVRATPSFLGRLVASLPYATPLEVVQIEGDWLRVQTAARVGGWVHKSALTTKTLAMTSGRGNAQSTVSRDELALAGKGFNSDIEKEYRKGNQKADFAAVDRLEQRKVQASQVESFRRDGDLKGGGR